MQKKAQQAAQPAQDNSWHERGELPPVGVVCLGHITSEDKWVETEVVAHRDGYVLGWCSAEKCGYHGNENSDFRPLRTEPEKAIDEMVSVILDYDGYMITSATAELVARQLYDAGYRKVKP